MKNKLQGTISIVGVWTLFLSMPLLGFSQGVNPPLEISDGELKKFANMKIMTSDYLQSKTEEIKKRVLLENKIQGGARYNEIKSAWGDSSKEADVNLTEEERLAFLSIANFQDSLQHSLLNYQISLIKNEKVLGETIYFRVVKALKEDPRLKERLDQMIKSLKKTD